MSSCSSARFTANWAAEALTCGALIFFLSSSSRAIAVLAAIGSPLSASSMLTVAFWKNPPRASPPTHTHSVDGTICVWYFAHKGLRKYWISSVVR